MKSNKLPRLCGGMLAVVLLAFSSVGAAATNTQRLIIGSDDNAQTKEDARQSQEQWNATRNLRSKQNLRDEKDFDKYDRTVDQRDRCVDSNNINAYWESSTSRCLDRRTGRALMMP